MRHDEEKKNTFNHKWPRNGTDDRFGRQEYYSYYNFIPYVQESRAKTDHVTDIEDILKIKFIHLQTTVSKSTIHNTGLVVD